MSGSNTKQRAGLHGFARSLVTGWAILGGVILLCVVLLNVVSVIGSTFWAPFPGDFEMTEVGVAVAAFMFLPYCQLTDANVTADIFTANASRRWVAVFALLASVGALGFSLLLLWRMYAGLLDQKAYGYTTTILQFPHWVAFVPILMSLALLALAAALTLRDSLTKLSES
ncbi:MAG TPA: TRAP transporter small permease subunit [Paracoccaceae bacterium]|nr:TRAP transporter small permease subunit [Paracoccaceae bacterium]